MGRIGHTQYKCIYERMQTHGPLLLQTTIYIHTLSCHIVYKFQLYVEYRFLVEDMSWEHAFPVLTRLEFCNYCDCNFWVEEMGCKAMPDTFSPMQSCRKPPNRLISKRR